MLPNQLNKAIKACNQGLKLKAILRDQTMAIQGKPQRDERTQNSLKTDQNKVKDSPRWHLNGLSLKACIMVQTWSIKHKPFEASKEP